MKIIKKAYRVFADNLEEPWHYDDIICYGTAGEAKADAFSNSELRWANTMYDENVTFLDLRAKRAKEYDIVEYDGSECKRYDVEAMEWVKNRDAEALKLTVENPDSLFLVWAGCYGSYWGSNHCGYTSKKYLAGKYSAEEAYKIVKGNDKSRGETLELLDVGKFNEEICNEVFKLFAAKNKIDEDILKLQSKIL